MSQSNRQSELFAGNDWLAAYRAFTEVNLNAFDFNTIRSAMVEYIRRNYPEDFNDWIESSEFVALIDLLAYLGQSLAFRTDINARENFLDAARRRESILRLARSLSYNAKRNYPARGLVKLTEIRSTFDVYDSTGRNLNNIAIRWDDPNNPDWFEQWVIVLNASLIETNPFGVPLKTENIDGVETQLYRVDNVPTTAGNYPFSATVNNQSYNFDICNADFNTSYGFVEREPDPNGPFHLIYRSDGNGNSSPNTGFFLYFKQGTLQKSDFSISEPQENRSIFIDTAGINETDVWVQSVDDFGSLIPDGSWTRVGHVPSDDIVKVLLTTENITYNSIDVDVQNIFQVVTQEQDRIALRFGDGRFGLSPVGNLRIWYRVSANQNLNIRPEDMQGLAINVPFFARNNTQKRLTLTFSLQEAVNNGVNSESNADVRRRAARVYGTQGRMVSASDYNELPVQTNLAVRLKAVNRVYSGQSRFIDLNDPTGNYQNTKVFADDGAFYLLEKNESQEVSQTVASVEEMITKYIADVAASVALRDFYSNWLYKSLPTGTDIYLPSFNRFSNDYTAKSDVRREVRENLELNRTFALGFNNEPGEGWYVLTSSEVNPDLDDPYEFVSTASPGPNSWLIHVEFNNNFWRITNRGLNYVFESERDCKFFFVSEYKSIDPNTGRAGADTVNLLKSPNNFKGVVLTNNEGGQNRLTSDLILKLEDPFIYDDGFHEPSRVKVRFNDRQSDGIPDVPFTYQALKNISTDDQGRLNQLAIVHLNTTDTDGYPVQRLIKRLEPDITQLLPGEYGYVERIDNGNVVDIYKGNPGYLIPRVDDIVGNSLRLNEQPTDYLVDGRSFTLREGVNNLVYQWNHFAPSSHRIDPAISNIVDIFVLTREYNDAMISWRNAGANPADMPKAPSELNLRTTFNPLEEFKMFSDEIVWRPVKFKLLFGQSAEPQFRSKFKIVKLAGTSMSDGEIKSRVIEAVRDFFEVNNWDFGETFFFSELGAYIHRQLATAISSVELVPVLNDSYFGNLREIRCAPDELFFATAQVSDVDIITANTPTNLRIR
jgi:hypothetical protein